MSLNKVYDALEWSVEPADYSVGIFGETVVHEACPKDYEEGAEIIEGALVGRKVRNMTVYAKQEVTFKCLDCGAEHTFTEDVFMGFDGEEGV